MNTVQDIDLGVNLGKHNFPRSERLCRSVAQERIALGNYLTTQRDFFTNNSFSENKFPPYLEFLANLAGTLPSMAENCRVSVNIPALNEERLIKNFLMDYLQQEELEHGESEILVIVSGPFDYKRDRTSSITREVASNSSIIPIYIIDLELPQGVSNVGLARKIAADLTFFRSIQRQNQRANLYIQLEDADNFGFSNTLLRSVIDTFDLCPELDTIKRKLFRDPLEIIKHDWLFLERLLVYATELCFFREHSHLVDNFVPSGKTLSLGQSWMKIVTSAADTAITAESLALIGGFQPVVRSEDLILGDALALLRGQSVSGGVLLSSRSLGIISECSYSNARRNFRALEGAARQGSFNFIQYEDFADYSSVNETRLMDSEGLLNLTHVQEISDFSILPDSKVVELANDLLSYFKDAFESFNLLDLNLTLQLYADFLSSRLFGVENSIIVCNESLVLATPAILRNEIERRKKLPSSMVFLLR